MPKKKFDDFSVKYNMAAPCGMYCGYCRQYLQREMGIKKGCEGCRVRNKNCVFIRKDCPYLNKGVYQFCHECKEFPCADLKAIDGLYQKRYQTSFIEDLKRMKDIGVDAWLEEKRAASKCPACGGRLCIHDAKCYDCGALMLKE